MDNAEHEETVRLYIFLKLIYLEMPVTQLRTFLVGGNRNFLNGYKGGMK